MPLHSSLHCSRHVVKIYYNTSLFKQEMKTVNEGCVRVIFSEIEKKKRTLILTMPWYGVLWLGEICPSYQQRSAIVKIDLWVIRVRTNLRQKQKATFRSRNCFYYHEGYVSEFKRSCSD